MTRGSADQTIQASRLCEGTSGLPRSTTDANPHYTGISLLSRLGTLASKQLLAAIAEKPVRMYAAQHLIIEITMDTYNPRVTNNRTAQEPVIEAITRRDLRAIRDVHSITGQDTILVTHTDAI